MSKVVRIAAVADLHVKERDKGKWNDFFRLAEESADILLLCGDLTDHGTQAEAEVLKAEITQCNIPILAVLGNHDFENGTPEVVKETLKDCIRILDGESCVIKGIGFAGVKGFAGGLTGQCYPCLASLHLKILYRRRLTKP